MLWLFINYYIVIHRDNCELTFARLVVYVYGIIVLYIKKVM